MFGEDPAPARSLLPGFAPRCQLWGGLRARGPDPDCALLGDAASSLPQGGLVPTCTGASCPSLTGIGCQQLSGRQA